MSYFRQGLGTVCVPGQPCGPALPPPPGVALTSGPGPNYSFISNSRACQEAGGRWVLPVPPSKALPRCVGPSKAETDCKARGGFWVVPPIPKGDLKTVGIRAPFCQMPALQTTLPATAPIVAGFAVDWKLLTIAALAVVVLLRR